MLGPVGRDRLRRSRWRSPRSALGPENVIAVRLPSRHTEQVHLDDAGPHRRGGRAAAREHADDLDRAAARRASRVRPGVHEADAAVRQRQRPRPDDPDLRRRPGSTDGLVLGTENRSEYLLGYFTRFGDAASDIEPIADLYKTEVRIGGAAPRPAGGGDRQASDRRPVGRSDGRGGARIHLPRRRPGAGRDADRGLGARGRLRPHRRRIDVVRRVTRARRERRVEARRPARPCPWSDQAARSGCMSAEAASSRSASASS